MSTKAQLMVELKETQAQLKSALDNSVGSATARTLSSALLDNLSELKSQAEDVLGEAEEVLQQLEDLYSTVDNADDDVIRVLP